MDLRNLPKHDSDQNGLATSVRCNILQSKSVDLRPWLWSGLLLSQKRDGEALLPDSFCSMVGCGAPAGAKVVATPESSSLLKSQSYLQGTSQWHSVLSDKHIVRYSGPFIVPCCDEVMSDEVVGSATEWDPRVFSAYGN